MENELKRCATSKLRPCSCLIIGSRVEPLRSEWNGDETFFYLEQASDKAIFNGELFKDKD